MVGVAAVHLMVWCGVWRRVAWVACRGRLRWGEVVLQLVGVAVILGHQGVGIGGGGGVVMVLVAALSLACVNGVPCAAWIRAGRGLWPGCRARVLRYGGSGGGRW